MTPRAGEDDDSELRDMARRFRVAAVLTVPVFALAMLPMIPGVRLPHALTAAANWVGMALATPVVFWAGWPFFVRAAQALRNRTANMFTLIAMGTKPNLRVRLTGSMYRNEKALSNTLYGGDRAGSRYYYVLENTAALEASQFTSGNINPGFRNSVTAFQINPFVKFGGLEVFGVIERAEGKAVTEAANRTFNQQAVDLVYRFAGDALQVGARYNRVDGRLVGMTDNVEGNRWQFGGGWFVTPGLLVKAEYVNQEFKGYPVANIRNGGQFKGMMLEGVVAF